MRKSMIIKLNSEKGQSLVETALVLPILLLLFCGIVDFAWIMGNHIITENGCREGARLGAVVASETDYQTQVIARVNAVTPSFSHGGLQVSASLTNQSDPRKGDVKVAVDYTFMLLTPLAQTILGKQNYTASAFCVMKAE